MTTPVRLSHRWSIAVALGILAAIRAWESAKFESYPRDLAQSWYAARALLHGANPYNLIGPGRPFEWAFPWFYPLPAAVSLLPLAPFSQTWACTIFAALAAGCFAWALMEHGYAPLLGFASASLITAVEGVQWSPLLTGSMIIAPLAVFLVAKPTVGLALFVARPTRWAVLGGGGLILAAFLAQPQWLFSWHAALAAGASLQRATKEPFIAPAMMPGGVLALLALLRWRRPEARLVAAMACVPQTLVLYETVPLFLVPRSLRECELMFVLSYLVLWLTIRTTTGESFATVVDVSGEYVTLLLYLPATMMVLRRPNEGIVPEWLEAQVIHLPAWLRGRRSVA